MLTALCWLMLVSGPGPCVYGERLAVLSTQRQALAAELKRAPDPEPVLARAEALMISALARELLPCWLGTSWDFNGTTRQPRQGAIACGYLVTTLLLDMGLPIDRIRLAQLPSEAMIRELLQPKLVRRYSAVAYARFLDDLLQWGPGVYIVGLDQHTGFLVHNGKGLRFIHSSYVSPSQVVSEEPGEAVILARSRYRVVGKLSGDRQLLRRWLSR